MGSFRNVITRELWRLDEDKVLVRRQPGWGWTINFAAVARRLQGCD